MTAKFNGKWEVERVIDLLLKENTPWSKDLASRLKNQIDSTKSYFESKKLKRKE